MAVILYLFIHYEHLTPECQRINHLYQQNMNSNIPPNQLPWSHQKDSTAISLLPHILQSIILKTNTLQWIPLPNRLTRKDIKHLILSRHWILNLLCHTLNSACYWDKNIHSLCDWNLKSPLNLWILLMSRNEGSWGYVQSLCQKLDCRFSFDAWDNKE